MSSDQFGWPLCLASTSESLVHALCGATNGFGFTGSGVQTSICAGSCPASRSPDIASTRHAPTASAIDRLSVIGEPPVESSAVSGDCMPLPPDVQGPQTCSL